MMFIASHKSLFWAAAFLIAFLIGGFSDRHDLFPFPALRALKTLAVAKPKTRFDFDRFGVLTEDERKTAVPCPQQTDRTAVLLVMGQSNAGNHAGQPFRSEHGDKVVNFYNGRCFIAASPLLGSDGIVGEYWTELGNQLIDKGVFDRVVLAPAAISGSRVSRWIPDGDLHPLMTNTVAQLQKTGYRVTDTLWTQGEIDYVVGTSEAAYRNDLSALIESLRAQNVTTPVYVSVTSKCLGESNGGTQFHVADNPISRAQNAIPDPRAKIRAGINTDALLGDLDRYDDCHFSGSGEQKVAKAWADLIASAQ